MRICTMDLSEENLTMDHEKIVREPNSIYRQVSKLNCIDAVAIGTVLIILYIYSNNLTCPFLLYVLLLVLIDSKMNLLNT